MSDFIFQGKNRSVDIVFCIDGTGSMSPCFESVTANARRFYTDLSGEVVKAGASIDMMRIKIIVFRDYKSDGAEAMVESRFFELPSEEEELSAYLATQEAHGGCNENANGLEALYLAMMSDFVTGQNDRQVIVLCADTTAIPLLERKMYQHYPSEMVDEDELLNLWTASQDPKVKLRQRNKRLIMFAPVGSVYERMKQTYNRSIFQPVEIHNGMDDISFDIIIRNLAASVSS